MFIYIFRNAVRWFVNGDLGQKLMLFGGHDV